MKNMFASGAVPASWENLAASAVCIIYLLVIAGCASTEVVERKQFVNEKLPRPSKIVIYDFVADPAEVPKDSALAAHAGGKTPAPTPEKIALGRKLGANIAAELTREIREMGLPAEKASPGTKLQVNDIVLRGYFLSLSEGNAAKRVVVGFGYGTSELETLVEGYQMTAKGLRILGSAKLKSVGSKTPGGGLGAATMIAKANPVGLIVGGTVKGYGEISGNSKVEGLARATAKEIAEKLQIRFKEEGWIK